MGFGRNAPAADREKQAARQIAGPHCARGHSNLHFVLQFVVVADVEVYAVYVVDATVVAILDVAAWSHH